MRSELVFFASRHVQNRFMLCHWVRMASRRFHKSGDPIQETITKVLGLVDHQNSGVIRDTNNLAELPAHGSVAVRYPVRAAQEKGERLPQERLQRAL